MYTSYLLEIKMRYIKGFFKSYKNYIIIYNKIIKITNRFIVLLYFINN